ncbi:carboxylesterase/lipase family protein [Sciscionella marina]|uniref:carboxylesterase/lipase family protein n=1 Tax=Sciscionella marina TaxID=508770 RepID=UPI00037691E2|nr:carboxylesterase family protein [Sciscionella marina]
MVLSRWAVICGMLSVLFGSTACAADPPPAKPSDPAVVHTDAGSVRGSVQHGTRVFQRIPYAAPPVGELRWRDPRPVAPWQGVRDATKPSPSCAQNPGETAQPSDNEDCLYLNVTTPAKKPGKPKPVIVWIHGGVFMSGTSNGFDAKRWANRGDAIVVTINYRLGMLGNFGIKGLPGSGTFALRDQQAALKWVQRNAAAFGGNPGNVTIAGQSAGAMSNCAHLTSPTAAGLFGKAIMQSGSCGTNWLKNFDAPHKKAGAVFEPVTTVQRDGQQAAAELGCAKPDPRATIDCLRALPVKRLQPVLSRFVHPAYHTAVLPEKPADALREGHFRRVPVISGNVHDEGTMSAAAYENGGPISEQTYDSVLGETFGADRAKVAAEYPRAAYGSAAQAFAAMITDRKWSCTQYADSRNMARYAPVHQYEFADPAPPPMWAKPKMPMGTYHSSDIWSLFDLGGYPPQFSEEQKRLADQIVDYWSGFAHNGKPEGPAWQALRSDAQTPYVQSLAPGTGGIHPVDLAAEHHCSFWKKLGK